MRRLQKEGRGEHGIRRHLNATVLFFVVLVLGTALDQVTKAVVFRNLEEGRHYEVIPQLLSLVLSLNPGALFGMLPNQGMLLAGLAIIAFGVILYFIFRGDGTAWSAAAFGFLAAGATGNLIDRLFNNLCVRDFIDLHIGQYHWPTFNVADICICVGLGMLIYAEFARAGEAKRPSGTS